MYLTSRPAKLGHFDLWPISLGFIKEDLFDWAAICEEVPTNRRSSGKRVTTEIKTENCPIVTLSSCSDHRCDEAASFTVWGMTIGGA